MPRINASIKSRGAIKPPNNSKVFNMSYDAPKYSHIGIDQHGYRLQNLSALAWAKSVGHAKKEPKKAPKLSGGKYQNEKNSVVLCKCAMGDAEAIAEYEYRGGAYHIHS